MSETKYPRQIYAAQHRTISLSVEAVLVKSVGADGHPPLEIYQEGLSRFVFSIFENKHGGQSATANIRVQDVAGMFAAAQAAYQNEMFWESGPARAMSLQAQAIRKCVLELKSGTGKKENMSGETARMAHTRALANVTMAMGTYKGKSPLNILTADPSQRDGLIHQRDFLLKNVDKYPRNQEQADAISAALELLQQGCLTGESDAGQGGMDVSMQLEPVPLFVPLPHPLIRKEQNGLCPTYEIGLRWICGREYPVEILIRNYKAPVIRQDNGAVQVQTEARQDDKQMSFNLSAPQWFDLERAIRAHMTRFEILSASAQLKEAAEISYRQAQAWKNQQD